MSKPKIILGIETSCDETAAAIVQNTKYGVQILSNVVASSAKLQEKYGGVIPEQAAREQIKSIIPVIKEALIQSNLYPQSSKNYLPSSIVYRPAIDAIAVTYGPGLIGSLLVGVETAKTLSLVWEKPLIPINHLIGHFYANWINQDQELRIKNQALKPLILNSSRFILPSFPCIGLLVSGGHTDLVLFSDHGKYKYLGGTRDDAAGECFDKCARLLGLPYPGGPAIARLAESAKRAKLATQGDALQLNLPRPMIDSDDFDFSFSGLKTAVANLLHTSEEPRLTLEVKRNLAASIEQAITDVLVKKTIKAVQTFKVTQIIAGGGVAANQTLSKKLKERCLSQKLDVRIFLPEAKLCTDNAVYIATTAFFNYHPIKPIELQANPNLSLSD